MLKHKVAENTLMAANHRAVRRPQEQWLSIHLHGFTHTVFLSNDLYFEALLFLNVTNDILADMYGTSPASVKKLRALPN